QREISPAGKVGRVQDNPGEGIKRTGRTDADSGKPTRSGGGLIEGMKNSLQPRLGGGVRNHGYPNLGQDPPTRVHQSGGDFGATNIDPGVEKISHAKSALPRRDCARCSSWIR